MTAMNLVTLKARAKHEAFVQQTGLWFVEKKCSCLAPALGLTKFTNVRIMILVTLCCAT
jgi:hypothetical protein